MQMPAIVLTTLNARYIHSAFGLRYLLANMQELQPETIIREFTINDEPQEIVGRLLADNPRILGFGVYIWNVEPVSRVVRDLRRLRPDITLVLGGPEVSFEDDLPELASEADFIIAGEGDHAFRELCRHVLAGQPPSRRFIQAPVPDLATVQLPYDFYTDDDIAHRVLYVEASRGCPFTCEFCLSALEIPVRAFPLPAFLETMQTLLNRGARQFKFVDRTFNLNLRVSRTILEFFLERLRPGMFLHFEMIPDRLPDGLREVIARFPPGVLQFEIGVQSLNPDVNQTISRPQDNERLTSNLRWLRSETGVHIHTDLIIGLPGESPASIASGFDRLRGMGPQEIQLGLLKRLRGTPITRHDDPFRMIYSPHPPYDILQTRDIPFDLMLRFKHLAEWWDRLGNSGRFVATLPWLLDNVPSAFAELLAFTDWLQPHVQSRHGIALPRQFELLFRYLTEVRGLPAESVAEAVWSDYIRTGRRDRPSFLREFALSTPQGTSVVRDAAGPPRQGRHSVINVIQRPAAEESGDPEHVGSQDSQSTVGTTR
jgi:radical SAM superfamily enzyme YgiQ (UPF0313 family)